MISCERWKDGFLLTVEGMRVLRHASSFPSLHVLVPRDRPDFVQGALQGKGLRMAWRKLGSCQVHSESAERIQLDFPGFCRLNLSYDDRILELGFEKTNDSLHGLRISIGADTREVLLGAGPSADYDLKRTGVGIPAPGPADDRRRIPAIFSSLGTWMHVAGGGDLVWKLMPARTEIRCSAFPVDIALGFGKNALAGIELLTRYRARKDFPGGSGGRMPLPDEIIECPVIDARNGRTTGPIEKALVTAGLSPKLMIADDGRTSSDADATLGELFAAGDERVLSVSAWASLINSSSLRTVLLPADHPATARELVRSILSLSLSGTGHACIPVGDPHGCALLELAAFGPVFLIEAAACLDSQPGLHRLMAAAAMYGMLLPYRKHCEEIWQGNGTPMWHHPAMRYPEEGALWELDDQFMSGPDLLIAPPARGTGSGDKECRQLCLPDDEWIHLWTSRRFRKGWAVVADPPGKPAIFYRARSSFASLFDEVRKKATRF